MTSPPQSENDPHTFSGSANGDNDDIRARAERLAKAVQSIMQEPEPKRPDESGAEPSAGAPEQKGGSATATVQQISENKDEAIARLARRMEALTSGDSGPTASSSVASSVAPSRPIEPIRSGGSDFLTPLVVLPVDEDQDVHATKTSSEKFDGLAAPAPDSTDIEIDQQDDLPSSVEMPDLGNRAAEVDTGEVVPEDEKQDVPKVSAVTGTIRDFVTPDRDSLASRDAGKRESDMADSSVFNDQPISPTKNASVDVPDIEVSSPLTPSEGRPDQRQEAAQDLDPDPVDSVGSESLVNDSDGGSKPISLIRLFQEQGGLLEPKDEAPMSSTSFAEGLGELVPDNSVEQLDEPSPWEMSDSETAAALARVGGETETENVAKSEGPQNEAEPAVDGGPAEVSEKDSPPVPPVDIPSVKDVVPTRFGALCADDSNLPEATSDDDVATSSAPSPTPNLDKSLEELSHRPVFGRSGAASDPAEDRDEEKNKSRGDIDEATTDSNEAEPRIEAQEMPADLEIRSPSLRKKTDPEDVESQSKDLGLDGDMDQYVTDSLREKLRARFPVESGSEEEKPTEDGGDIWGTVPEVEDDKADVQETKNLSDVSQINSPETETVESDVEQELEWPRATAGGNASEQMIALSELLSQPESVEVEEDDETDLAAVFGDETEIDPGDVFADSEYEPASPPESDDTQPPILSPFGEDVKKGATPPLRPSPFGSAPARSLDETKPINKATAPVPQEAPSASASLPSAQGSEGPKPGEVRSSEPSLSSVPKKLSSFEMQPQPDCEPPSKSFRKIEWPEPELDAAERIKRREPKEKSGARPKLIAPILVLLTVVGVLGYFLVHEANKLWAQKKKSESGIHQRNEAREAASDALQKSAIGRDVSATPIEFGTDSLDLPDRSSTPVTPSDTDSNTSIDGEAEGLPEPTPEPEELKPVSIDEVPDPTASGAEITDDDPAYSGPAADRSDPRVVLDAFLAATTVQERSRYVQLDYRIRQRMQAYYAGREDISTKTTSVEESFHGYTPGSDKKTILYRVKTERNSQGYQISLEEGPGGYAVDWEFFSQCEDKILEGFCSNPEKGRNGRFLVVLKRVHSFSPGLTKDDGFYCLELKPPYLEPAFRAYVEKDSAAGELIEKNYDWTTTYFPLVDLEWAEPTDGGDLYLRLNRIVRDRWKRS